MALISFFTFAKEFAIKLTRFGHDELKIPCGFNKCWHLSNPLFPTPSSMKSNWSGSKAQKHIFVNRRSGSAWQSFFIASTEKTKNHLLDRLDRFVGEDTDKGAKQWSWQCLFSSSLLRSLVLALKWWQRSKLFPEYRSRIADGFFMSTFLVIPRWFKYLHLGFIIPVPNHTRPLS